MTSSKKDATFGERIADSVASFGGSRTFIIAFLVVLLAYSGFSLRMGKSSSDPYPFILLNLFLSMRAVVQAPVIMMSQNRQDTKDRLRGELDYDVNRRAEAEIQGLSRKLNMLDDRIADMHANLQKRDAQQPVPDSGDVFVAFLEIIPRAKFSPRYSHGCPSPGRCAYVR
jgi:CRP/FNR family transcriptional regulator, cyclic AMP receptor protein